MNKSLHMLKIGFLIISLLGLFLGPVSWYKSVSFFKEYVQVKMNGKETLASIERKHSKKQYRYNRFYVNIYFTDEMGQKNHKNDLEINAKLFDVLTIGKKVNILYDQSTVLLEDNYKNEYVPPIKKRYWGMGLTIFSFLFLMYKIFINRQGKINRKGNKL